MATKLQNLAAFWQNFGLANVQKDLDDVATEITARQDDSDSSRKALIEQLRDFKKNSNDEVRQSVAPVVKSFQNEVDSLAKRAKAAEKAFFDIYRTLADMPDPLPILEQSIERNQQLSSKIQDYEIETKQLRETMGEQAKEIAELKTKEKKMNELQAMINQYDKNIDETLNVKLKAEVEHMQADFDDKLKLIEDDKMELEKKCRDAEAVAKTNQHLLDLTQSELFEANNKLSQKSDAKSDEVEMILNDLEAANHRAVLAEKEADALREQLKLAQDRVQGEVTDEVDSFAIKDLNRELAAKDKEVHHLASEISKIQNAFKAQNDDSRSKIAELEATNNELNDKLHTCQGKLKGMSDYDSIKKDLGILRSLEFGDESLENEQLRPLEVMILERSKMLQAENTSLRMEKERLGSELTLAKESLAEKMNETERQSQLISELEDHVEKLQDMSNINRGEAEGRSSTDILYDLDLGKSPGRDSPVSISSSFYEKNADANSLLPIIQAQRERYKKRNEELEEQQSQQVQQMAVLQAEVKDLQADNVKLYEKIRFLQGYQQRKKDAADSVMIPVETRYKSQYEQKLDPFTTFSNQEKQRRYTQLNIVEKIILSMVHFMLSNKIARLFVFAYSVLLHGLVFLVLMRMAYADSYRRDHAASEWQQKFLDHMNEAHADNHG